MCALGAFSVTTIHSILIMNKTNIALWLEKFLVSWKNVPWDEVPEGMQEFKDEEYCRMQGGPIGIGKHPTLGWFVLACGQGPFVIWIGVDDDTLMKGWKDRAKL